MFAILETGSKQYKVAEGDVLEIELLNEEKISKDNIINFDHVLLVKNDKLHIGQPFVKNARIEAKVLEELKAPKIIVFKKKPKKRYKRTQGHRQQLHRIQIEKIEIKTETKADAKAKAEPKVKAKPKPKAEPKAQVEPKIKAKPKPEPKAKPKAKVEPKAKAEPKVKAKPKPKPKTKAAKEEKKKKEEKE